jgi:hypothetical protein
MPKDEIDPEDPMELRGGFATREDTSELMTECFIEEFLRWATRRARSSPCSATRITPA